MNSLSNRIRCSPDQSENRKKKTKTDVHYLGRGSLPCANNLKIANIFEQLTQLGTDNCFI